MVKQLTKTQLKKIIQECVQETLSEVAIQKLFEAKTKTDEELKKVLNKWVEENLKSSPGPHWFPPRELFKYREYMRPTRPDLQKSMKARGFDPKYPIRIAFGKNGGIKVHEGNHRLKTSIQLGLEKVPVVFDFKRTVVKAPVYFSDDRQKKDKEILRKDQEEKREKAFRKKYGIKTPDPKKQHDFSSKELDDLMDLLFTRPKNERLGTE